MSSAKSRSPAHPSPFLVLTIQDWKGRRRYLNHAYYIGFGLYRRKRGSFPTTSTPSKTQSQTLILEGDYVDEYRIRYPSPPQAIFLSRSDYVDPPLVGRRKSFFDLYGMDSTRST
jgi:hypothetical protein